MDKSINAKGEHVSIAWPQDVSKATRFEVIDDTVDGDSRAYVKHGVNVQLSYQDEGRTLKVFLTERSEED